MTVLFLILSDNCCCVLGDRLLGACVSESTNVYSYNVWSCARLVSSTAVRWPISLAASLVDSVWVAVVHK